MKKIGGGKSRPSPKMNVTPLVDVVLVLLIIFMIAIPSMEHNAQVELPQIFNPDEEQPSEMDPITVSVTEDNRLFVEQDELPEDEVVERLEEVHELTPTRRVLVRGDAHMPYEQVRHVFELIQDIGFAGVSLRVGEKADAARETRAEAGGE